MCDGIEGNEQRQQQTGNEDAYRPGVQIEGFGEVQVAQVEGQTTIAVSARHYENEDERAHDEQEADQQYQPEYSSDGYEESHQHFQKYGETTPHVAFGLWLLPVFNHDVGEVLGRQVLAFHLQYLLGLLGLRHGNGHRDIEENETQVDREEETAQMEQPEQWEQEEVGAQEQQGIADAPPGGVGVGVGGKAGEHTSHQFVVGVAVELLASRPGAYIFTESVGSRLKRVKTMTFLLSALGSLALGIFFASQFFGPPDTGDDVFHMLDGDGLGAVGLQFVEELGDAGLDVVGNLLAAFLLAEGGSQRLDVVL